MKNLTLNECLIAVRPKVGLLETPTDGKGIIRSLPSDGGQRFVD